MPKPLKNIIVNRVRYGLILNGKHTTEKQAKAFAKQVTKLIGNKTLVRKYAAGKFVVYLEKAKGTKFTDAKANMKKSY